MTGAPRVKPPGGAFVSIQLMRGVAALLVVVYHTVMIMAQPEYGALRSTFAPPQFGWMGVNFFFVLSGFIILHAHRRDIGRREALGTYAWRRFVRVYPIYWLFLTLFTVAALGGLGSRDFSTGAANMLTAYTLVPFETVPTLPLKVAWTLLYEIQFYAIFAIAILDRRAGAIAFALWLVVIGYSATQAHGLEDGFPQIWGVNFFVGMLACLAIERWRGVPGLPILGIGIAVLVALCAFGGIPAGPSVVQNRPAYMTLMAIAFGLVIVGGALSEHRRTWPAPGWLRLIGDGSYAIYLLHSAVISVAMIVHTKLGLGLPADLLFPLLIVGATIAGVIAHLLIERPLLRLLRPLGPKPPRKAAVPALAWGLAGGNVGGAHRPFAATPAQRDD